MVEIVSVGTTMVATVLLAILVGFAVGNADVRSCARHPIEQQVDTKFAEWI